MTESEPKPFGGFSVSHPTLKFEVTGRGLQLYRRWWRTSPWEDKPVFSSAIGGRAVADHDHVCVFGINRRSNIFDLTVRGDHNIKDSWEMIKGVELVVDTVRDSEQRRIRDIQHQLFDKSPPTATLFNQGSHWSLECEIPLPVLEQLSTDLIARCVDSVSIQIEWPFGFIDNLSGAWGFFKGSQLRGHVSTFTWVLQQRDQIRKCHRPRPSAAKRPNTI